MKKIYIGIFFFGLISLYANCPDSFSAKLGELEIKLHYSMEDLRLSNELDLIIGHINENLKKNESDFKIAFDMKNLNAQSLLELKEIEMLIEKSNRVLFHKNKE